MKHRKIFEKILKETLNFNSQKQVLHKSTPVFSNDLINTNHRQISLTRTDHFNSKFSKVI